MEIKVGIATLNELTLKHLETLSEWTAAGQVSMTSPRGSHQDAKIQHRHPIVNSQIPHRRILEKLHILKTRQGFTTGNDVTDTGCRLDKLNGFTIGIQKPGVLDLRDGQHDQKTSKIVDGGSDSTARVQHRPRRTESDKDLWIITRIHLNRKAALSHESLRGVPGRPFRKEFEKCPEHARTVGSVAR